jgi:hypothetical protein
MICGPVAEKVLATAERHGMSLAKLLQDMVLAYEGEVAGGYEAGTCLEGWTAQSRRRQLRWHHSSSVGALPWGVAIGDGARRRHGPAGLCWRQSLCRIHAYEDRYVNESRAKQTQTQWRLLYARRGGAVPRHLGG